MEIFKIQGIPVLFDNIHFEGRIGEMKIFDFFKRVKKEIGIYLEVFVKVKSHK